MNRFLKFLVPSIVMVLVAAAVVVVVMAGPAKAQSGPGDGSAAAADADPQVVELIIPATVHYQGFLTDDVGEPVNGPVDLQFDLFKDSAGGSSLWSQSYNGVFVNEGYFAVQLGPLAAADFELPAGSTTLYVQVTILTGGPFALPRQPLASAPYAFLAQQASEAPWDGLSGVPAGFADNIDDVEFENVVTVAKSGAPFSSIQAAIDSIGDAGDLNRYLVWVGPGRYEEQVVMKPYVHLVGAGRDLTWIESNVTNADIYPPEEGTLHLAAFANVRDLTVHNDGSGFRNVAILAADGVQEATLENVSALSDGVGENSSGILLNGTTTVVNLQHVTGEALNASSTNVALEIAGGADAWVQDGRYAASGGVAATGIVATKLNTRLDAFGVEAAGANADTSAGLIVDFGAEVSLHSGNFEASNATTENFGILVTGLGTLDATGVVAAGLNGAQLNHGLGVSNAEATLNGGAFSGSGGVEAIGISNLSGGTLEAGNVSAKGEDGSSLAAGLQTENGSVSALNGGFFFAQGNGHNRGIVVANENSIVDVQHATIQAEGGPATSYGLYILTDAEAYVTLSEIFGVNSSVRASGLITRLQLTRLVGGGIGGSSSGSVTCLGLTYASNFYQSSCP